MIPGMTTKLTESTVASASTITAKSDIVHVTGSVTINTILPNFGGGFSGMIILNSINGVTLTASGNIAFGIAVTAYRPVWLVYSKQLSKWLINSGT